MPRAKPAKTLSRRSLRCQARPAMAADGTLGTATGEAVAREYRAADPLPRRGFSPSWSRPVRCGQRWARDLLTYARRFACQYDASVHRSRSPPAHGLAHDARLVARACCSTRGCSLASSLALAGCEGGERWRSGAGETHGRGRARTVAKCESDDGRLAPGFPARGPTSTTSPIARDRRRPGVWSTATPARRREDQATCEPRSTHPRRSAAT